MPDVRMIPLRPSIANALHGVKLNTRVSAQLRTLFRSPELMLFSHYNNNIALTLGFPSSAFRRGQTAGELVEFKGKLTDH
jgi:hypothetical protein